MTAATQSTPVVTNDIRQRWSKRVLCTCVFHAYLHGIIDRHEIDDMDLQVLPPAIHQVVFAKCQELIEEFSRKSASRTFEPHELAQDINRTLWNFLATWRNQGVIDRRLVEIGAHMHADVPRGANLAEST